MESLEMEIMEMQEQLKTMDKNSLGYIMLAIAIEEKEQFINSLKKYFFKNY